MMTNVQRHPTIPMTKRDSLVSNGTRVSLLANGTSSTTTKKLKENDYVNTNSNMVAGKKRTTKKVKRTDSYKIATNRQSVFDELDGVATGHNDFSRVPKQESGTKGLRTEDRTKYNTLPLRTEATCTAPQKKTSESRRRTHETGGSQQYGEIERNASQKSGTYPSPDTDEDQRSSQPDRKKKSAFKRMKERLILKFKKDRDHDESDKGKKRKKDKYKSPNRVKPNHTTTHDAFKTPNDDIEICEDIERDNKTKETRRQNGNSSRAPLPTGRNGFQRNYKGGVTNGGSSRKGDDESSQSNKGPGLFQTIRNSFRRKQAPQKYRKSKETIASTPETQNTSGSSQPQSSSSLERDNQPANRNPHQPSQPIDIHNPTVAHVRKIEEQFIDVIDADDSITELFGSLIDPEGQSVNSETLTPSNFRSRTRPDTSKLKLKGLKKFKPGSFDRGLSGRPGYGGDLSPTVEIDGLDYADAPPSQAAAQFQEEGDLEYAEVSEHEQQRRNDEVAKRLAAIGDSICSRRESESAGSSDEVEGHRVASHRRRLSQLEQDLLIDLRRFGDDIDGSLFSTGNSPRFTSMIPIISNIIRAQDYSGFQRVIQREISNTVGWEQVAWYTYLIKTTMCLAGAGKIVGTVVKNHATKYFSSTIKPWIQSRPNGWESIHEETDVESEVD